MGPVQMGDFDAHVAARREGKIVASRASSGDFSAVARLKLQLEWPEA